MILLAVPLLAACERGTVDLGFRPQPGAEYRYRYDIKADLVADLAGEPRRHRTSRARLEAKVVVLAVDDGVVRARVSIARDGGVARTLIARFDRGEQLSGIELIEGVPAEALGLGDLADLLGPSAGLPNTPVRPGETWVAESVTAGSGASRTEVVSGTARLERLGVEAGHDVAIVVTRLAAPVRSVDAAARTTVEGTQSTRARTVYDLGDGAVRRAVATTHGNATVVVDPPLGLVTDPVSGALTYVLRVATVRVG